MRSNTFNAFFRIAALVGVMGPSFLVSTARADDWDKKTILTINEPIQVRETLLQPGQYVFKLLNSQSDRHIVQIFNYNQSRIIDTELAIPNYRLEPTGKSRFTFWETPEGRVRAMRAWFYPGDNFGQEFPYPKQLAMAVNTSSATVTYKKAETSEAESTTAAATAVETPAPTPTPEPEAVAAAPAPEPAPQAPPPATEPAPAPAASTPTTLPKTGSSYPLIGLAGLLSLGGFGLLRRKVSA